MKGLSPRAWKSAAFGASAGLASAQAYYAYKTGDIDAAGVMFNVVAQCLREKK